MSLPTTDRTKLNNLSPNLVPQQIAVSALRLAVFQEIYTYLDNIITDLNAAQATGAVTTPKLADGGVTTLKLADSGVTAPKILDGAIITAKMADGGVTEFKLANDSVTATKIKDGSVTTQKIADLAMTTAKIADNAIVTVKLADGAVLTAKIADGAVTTVKLADGSVTAQKLSADVKDSANHTYSGAVPAVSTTKTALDALYYQLIQAIQSGSVSELSDARASITSHKTFATIRDRLDDESAHHKPTELQVTDRKLNRCIITLLSDDTRDGDYTILKPLAVSKNVPFTCATITGQVGTASDSLTLAQMKEMQGLGFEFISHTENHVRLVDVNEATVESECKNSSDWLRENGFTSDAIVYPTNAHSKTVRMIAKKYYRFAFGDIGNNIGVLGTYRVARIALGSWTSDNPTLNGNAEQNTLAYYKACVDYANANKLWLVFMLHSNATEFDAVQQDYLAQTIDYIKSLNIPVVKSTDGFAEKSNLVEIGEYNTSDAFDWHFAVGSNRDFSSNLANHKLLPATGFNSTTPITSFTKGMVTEICFVNADNSGFPDGGGVLLTYRSPTWEGISYQMWNSYLGKVQRRQWDATNNVWGSFVVVNDGADNTTRIKVLPANSVSPTALASTFDNNRISYCVITNASASGFPENAGGTLITDKIVTTVGYVRQRYVLAKTSKIYERYTNDDGSWGPFDSVSTVTKLLINNSITPSTAASTFDSGKISYCLIQSAFASGFPENAGGTVITDKLLTTNGYIRQRYIVVKTNRIYERYTNDDGTWGPFSQIGVTLKQYNDGTIPAADVSQRGTMIINTRPPGFADQVQVCVKLADDTYVWKNVSLV